MKKRMLCALLILLLASGCAVSQVETAAPDEETGAPVDAVTEEAGTEEAAETVEDTAEAVVEEDAAGVTEEADSEAGETVAEAIPAEEAVLEETANGDADVRPLEAVDGQEETESDPTEVDLGPLLDEGVPLAGSAPVSVLSPSQPGTATHKNGSAVIDYSNAADGYICVSWQEGGSPKLKVLVKGPSGTTYQYNLRTDGKYDTFPLSDGNGNYSVGVYKNTSGTQYATVLSGAVSVSLKDEFAPFVRPNQYVSYAADNQVVKKAAELCADAGDNLAKVEKIYSYVINNLTYDEAKAKTVKSGYLPDVDQTLSSQKGICFDYAALMAAMLRSQSVPVKLVVGYTGDAYHAWLNVWSEKDGWVNGKVYFDGKEWKLMDPTFASSSKESKSIMEYIGNGSNYAAKYLY